MRRKNCTLPNFHKSAKRSPSSLDFFKIQSSAGRLFQLQLQRKSSALLMMSFRTKLPRISQIAELQIHESEKSNSKQGESLDRSDPVLRIAVTYIPFRQLIHVARQHLQPATAFRHEARMHLHSHGIYNLTQPRHRSGTSLLKLQEKTTCMMPLRSHPHPIRHRHSCRRTRGSCTHNSHSRHYLPHPLHTKPSPNRTTFSLKPKKKTSSFLSSSFFGPFSFLSYIIPRPPTPTSPPPPRTPRPSPSSSPKSSSPGNHWNTITREGTGGSKPKQHTAAPASKDPRTPELQGATGTNDRHLAITSRAPKKRRDLLLRA